MNKLTLYIALELSNNKWKLAFSTGAKIRTKTIDARDLPSFWEEVSKTKVKWNLPEDIRTVSCFEAGRDGFWIHHWLMSHGVESLVVDSSSIEINRRHRQLKTDAIDVRKLTTMLIRYDGGEKTLWSVVHVPKEEAEDIRREEREIDRLKKERTSHTNRIKSLLVLHGISLKNFICFPKQLNKVRLWNGKELAPQLKSEIMREYERLECLNLQLKALEKKRNDSIVKTPEREVDKQCNKLYSLYGIGVVSSSVLVKEFFYWREFQNRRQVGSCAGLVGSPYNSGDSVRDQGITKAGSKRVRRLMVEIAWGWLRYQPNSELSQWFLSKYAVGGKRMRRVGIVAVARKLLIALWKYLVHNELPAGARLKGEDLFPKLIPCL
jgi:transposase